MKIIRVNLNKENNKIMEDITIIPIADVHIGDKLANLKLFKETIERIKNEPNTYTIINGDLCNMALKNSKSDVYSDDLSPMEQVITMVDYLKPIKDKILVIGTGNHEDRTQKETIQTLTTQNNLGVCVIGGIGEKKSNGGTQWYQQDRIYDNNVGSSLSTCANPYYQDKQLRIRKLTPCECYMLMGFDKKDYIKASKVNSNAQLYKQAGNSIVVNVLENILKNLL